MEAPEQILSCYKELINFEDKDQKNNFKWIEAFLKYQKRKHPDEDNRTFWIDAIAIHIRSFMSGSELVD